MRRSEPCLTASAFNEDGAVLIYDKSGNSKAPAIVCLWLMSCCGFNLMEALYCMQKSRPSANLSRPFLVELLQLDQNMQSESRFSRRSLQFGPPDEEEKLHELQRVELFHASRERLRQSFAVQPFSDKDIHSACQMISSISITQSSLPRSTDVVLQALHCELLQHDAVTQSIADELVKYVTSKNSMICDELFKHGFWQCVASLETFQDAILRRLVKAVSSFESLDFDRANSVVEAFQQAGELWIRQLREIVQASTQIWTEKNMNVVVANPAWPLKLVLPSSFFGSVASAPLSSPQIIIRDIPTATCWYRFKSAYECSHPGRSVVLLPHLGRADVALQCPDAMCKLSCPTAVMLVLAAVAELQSDQDFVPLLVVQQFINMPQRLFDLVIQSTTLGSSRLLQKSELGVRINVGLKKRTLIVKLNRTFNPR
eukprot:TRINITY_DN1231_c0_g1_i1.p1 TRINITY_DN1231_c0_g1~~TRINITY_DN1231_c0_g1_i1.p1  ORF type:complete len:428 (+),score=43.92 TRINITY_DN1231_c0_g1_i1:300-1583(+)